MNYYDLYSICSFTYNILWLRPFFRKKYIFTYTIILRFVHVSDIFLPLILYISEGNPDPFLLRRSSSDPVCLRNSVSEPVLLRRCPAKPERIHMPDLASPVYGIQHRRSPKRLSIRSFADFAIPPRRTAYDRRNLHPASRVSAGQISSACRRETGISRL